MATPYSKRLKILQIFNRYLEYGGEEGSVYRIGDTLQTLHDVEYFITSSRDLTTGLHPVALARKVYRNDEIARRLKRFQTVGRFDVWLIHNVFPVISPVAYEMAFAAKLPVVQYLHNYRISCVNGFFINHGEPCTRCIGGNFLPAFQTACWHESHLKSGLMGTVLSRVRRMGVLEKITHWIAISQAQKDLHVQIGIPAERITVIPHFYEVPEIPLSEARRSNVVYIGRLSPEKGIDVLLRAWKLAGSEVGNARLDIVGDGPERIRLEEIVQSEGLSNVHFTGFLNSEAQIRIWAEALVTVVPSIWLEPFGMVALEAWSRGSAVIGSATGGLNEIIDDHVNGWKFPMGDEFALAESLIEAIRNPDLCRQFADAGFVKLKTTYHRDGWLKKIDSVLLDAFGS